MSAEVDTVSLGEPTRARRNAQINAAATDSTIRVRIRADTTPRVTIAILSEMRVVEKKGSLVSDARGRVRLGPPG
jgi:hypothetical protein